MTGIAKEIPRAGSAEAQNGGADFTLQLDSAELLTGTPTVVEQVTTDLTISSESINSAAVEINGDTVAIGRDVQRCRGDCRRALYAACYSGKRRHASADAYVARAA